MKLFVVLALLVPAALCYHRVLLERDDMMMPEEYTDDDSNMFVDIDSKIRSHGDKIFVTLMCTGDFELKNVHFKWLKNGVEIRNANPLNPTYRFRLTPLSPRTLGHYQCAVQSDDTMDDTMWSYSPDMEIKVPHGPRRHKRSSENTLPTCTDDDECEQPCTTMAKNMVSEADKDSVRATWECTTETSKCACGAVL